LVTAEVMVWDDVLQTIGYKENRLFGPFMLAAYAIVNLYWTIFRPGHSLIPREIFIAAGQALSLLRIPFLWASWIILTPSYLLNTVFNIVVTANYWVLSKNGATQLSWIEPYIYDGMGASCLLETYKCPEIYLNYNPETGNCDHVCPDTTQYVSFQSFGCTECPKHHWRVDALNYCECQHESCGVTRIPIDPGTEINSIDGYTYGDISIISSAL
jgi:hypothetical protein